eukprot:5469531-Amphidinium_carterae.1
MAMAKVLTLSYLLAASVAHSVHVDTCVGDNAVPGRALMQRVANAVATAAPAGLSGNVGGLQVEYFYFNTGLNAVSVIDGVVADHTTV